MIYDFAELTPSPNINWTPCFEGYACTNLEVPLDYADASAGTTNIAFIKYSSSNESAQDILFNPGGPGSSGVQYVVGGGETLQQTLGTQYNIVSFDPRGVNNSGPAMTCFPGAPEARAQYTGASTTAPLPELFQSAKAYGEWCSAANKDTQAKYGGTAAVAQDMLHFIELQNIQYGHPGNEAKLWYYGVSYGTVLGQTFAALFPDRVGRMILDGNVFGVEHYTGLVPSDVDDTDDAFHFFFKDCFNAGPELCAFYGNSTSIEEIEERYRNLLQSLEDSPITVTDPKFGAPSVITQTAFSSWAFSSTLYGPLTGFPLLATVAAALEQGNGTVFMEANAAPSAMTSAYGAYAKNANYSSQEALGLITCVDANTRFNVTSVEQFEEVVDTYMGKSFYGGKTTALNNGRLCVGMSITPPPSQIFPGFKCTNTSFPILFIGTTGDPVTPLSSAYKMSALFEGSVVLTQDSPGHGFLATGSDCTTKYVQAYMAEGTLPEPDTVCQPAAVPFIPSTNSKALRVRTFV
ncbi:alpha/beta-hydrolase [Lindgomyces ingoldianus]|uniref:Alpha/beta-hydrolase n=1 Tax=Lindgomyces ingoldianus TaxID=673940 RepID=A0ACB6RGS3_9PLEO|nr:alpha/beta-hydrolase [Lindgomyces ingoldianus]KAF2477666.1 alpha/beta-hydrolase [Lindgomyces ingoldianus]